MVDVNLSNDLADRLGLTDASVSKPSHGAFDGAGSAPSGKATGRWTSSCGWTRPPSSFDDVRDTYVDWHGLRSQASPPRGCHLAPEWQTSRIVRRNGVHTLTVRAFPKPGVYASKILEQAMPKIKALELPTGYRI